MWTRYLLRGRETHGKWGAGRLLLGFGFVLVNKGEAGIGLNDHENVPVDSSPYVSLPC